MAIPSATSPNQSIAPSVMQTLQLQQAQRNADQARQNAHALQSAAAQAQVTADQADQQARAIGREAQQAQYIANQATQSLTTAQSGRQVQSRIGQIAQAVHQAVQAQPTPPATPAPVLNVQGQVTGQVVNVKA